MKVLITNAPLEFYHRTAFMFRDQGAVNLAILATVIEEEHDVRVVDNWHFLARSEGIFDEIERFSPDAVAISHSSEVDTERVHAVVRKIKRLHPRIIVIGGGQHPTMFPEANLGAGFDYVVRGEGEITFPALLAAIAKGTPVRDVAGVSFLAKGVLVSAPDRPEAKLDDLPFPSLEFVPKHPSWFFPGKQTSVIETARGCPFQCEFCIVTSYFHHRWHRRNNDAIIAQIKKIKYGLGVDHFYFLDESWGIDAPEYAEFCRKLLDEKLDIKWFPSGMRTDTIVKHPDLVALAAKAGMYGALIGFESYTDKTLTDVSKQSSIANNKKASEIFRKNGLVVFGVHIYGLPGEDDFSPTYRWGRKLSDVFCISMFSLLPGTPLFKKAEAENLVEKIPRETRLYPYSYWMTGPGRDRRAMTRRFMLWHLRYHISPRNLWETLVSKGIHRRFKLADYASCVQYFFLYFLKKLRPEPI